MKRSIIVVILLLSSSVFAAQQPIEQLNWGAGTVKPSVMQSTINSRLDNAQDNFTELYDSKESKAVVQASAPGDLSVDWYDTDQEPGILVLKKHNGTTWVRASSYGVQYQSSCASITAGMCVDTDDGKLYYHNGTAVVEVGTGGGSMLWPASDSAYYGARNGAWANLSGIFAAPLGSDDNYVTDAEKLKLGNLSGTNTGDQDLSGYALTNSVLSKTNTTSFTPTADYHPATMKFVLDSITAGGGYTDEQAQDAVGGMFSGNTETGITVTYNDTTGKVDFVVPTTLASFTDDSTHRFVTDTEKATWNAKQNALVAGTDYLAPNGSAANLTNFPTFNQSTTGSAGSISGMITSSGITGALNLTKTGTTARTATFPDKAGTVAFMDDIVAAPTDATISTTDVTTSNASTTKHGWLLKATAPSSGLRNILAIDNAETSYKNAALFDTTDPSTQAAGDTAVVGTAMTAARRDHKHAMPAAQTATTTAFTPNGSIAATTVQAAIQEVRDEAGAGSTTYPGAGISVSTGTAWGTSITPGSGVALALAAAVDGTGGLASVASQRHLITGTGITTATDTPSVGTDTISVTSNTYQAYDADWLGVTANGASLISAANYAAMRTLLDLEVGVDFNAYSANLATWSSTTPGTGVGTFLSTPSGANLASALTSALPTSKGGTGLTAIGTGVGTALGNNTGAIGGLPTIIASGAYTVDTASISANTCASAVAVTASDIATTDTIIATPNAILSSVAGFGVSTAGAVRVDVYPTSGKVNFQFCNPTGAAIDPGSVTFNWKVIR